MLKKHKNYQVALAKITTNESYRKCTCHYVDLLYINASSRFSEAHILCFSVAGNNLLA